MKRPKLIIAMIIIVSSLQAQVEQTYTEAFDNAFRNINRTDATTGILYERVVPFARLDNFNSNVDRSVDTSSFSHFIQAYSELYRAALGPIARLPWTVDDFREQVKINAADGVVDIGLLHFNFNMIDSVVGKQKINMVNDVLVDNPAITASLYLQKTAFVTSPLSAMAHGANGITFRFSNDFKFSNTSTSLTQLLVDFDDGLGLREVSMGTNVFVAYTESGEKTLHFVATYSDEQRFTAYGQIDYNNTPLRSQSRAWEHTSLTDDTITAKIPWTSFYSGRPRPAGNFNQGFIRIYFANSDMVLRKPILIVDGFDPGNDRQFEWHRKQEDGEKSIWELLYFDGTCGTKQHFGEMLLELGYDLVMLDFPDGAGYIERNAKVTIEVINELNRRLIANGSSEELVIVGPSMGGMITRYALAYMEQNPNENTNWGNHNTRLWISFDSPHQGANISYGAQHFLHFFGYVGGADDAKNVYDKTVNSIAARQMLKKHHSSSASSVFNRFYNNLNNLGYPTAPGLRRIAVSNGSLNGTRNGFGCNLVVELRTEALGKDITIAEIRLSPDNGSCDVFYGFFGEVTPWWTWLLLHGNASLATRRISQRANSEKCGIDGAPGSRFNTFEEVGKAVANNDKISRARINNHHHTFMTTLSVLDVSGIPDYCTDISNVDLVVQGMTPFDAYWGPMNKNMDHVSFDQDLVVWLMNEIHGNRISGSTAICATGNFTIDNPDNLPISWSVTEGFTIATENSTSATVLACSSGKIGTITAIVDGIPIFRTFQGHRFSIIGSNMVTNDNVVEYRILNRCLPGATMTWDHSNNLIENAAPMKSPGHGITGKPIDLACQEDLGATTVTEFTFNVKVNIYRPYCSRDGWIKANIQPPGCPNTFESAIKKDIIVGFSPDFRLISSIYNGTVVSLEQQPITIENPDRPKEPYFDEVIIFEGARLLEWNIHGIDRVEWQDEYRNVNPNSPLIGQGFFTDDVRFLGLYQSGLTDKERQMTIYNFTSRVHNRNAALAKVRLYNQCGASDWATLTYFESNTSTDDDQPPPSCRCGFRLPCTCSCCKPTGGTTGGTTIGTAFEYRIEKNPVDKDLGIIFTRKSSDEADNSSIETADNLEINISVKLYDNSGVVHRQTRHKRRRRDNESSVNFDVSNLREGTYYLHIESEGEIEKHQTVITR